MPHFTQQSQQPAQQTPRQRLEELRARQTSGPVGGPVLQAPAPQIPTGQPSPSPVLPSEREAARVRISDRERLEELRAKQGREVRGELSRDIASFRLDPVSAAVAGAEIGFNLMQPEPTPLLGRGGQLALQGATLGFGDEIQAGARAITQPIRDLAGTGRDRSMGDAFGEQAGVERQQLEETRQAAPVTSFGLEAAGGGGIGGGPITGFLGRSTSRAGLAGRSALVGGGTGGVVGAGEAEGTALERLPSAAVGAGAGALLGGASPIAIEGITRTGRVIARSAGRAFNNRARGRAVTHTQRRAWNRIMRSVHQDGVTAEQFQARLTRARELGIEDDFMFEMAGPQLLDLARGGTASGSEEAIKGLARVRIRQSNVESRVAEDLRDAIGSDGSDFLSRSQSINNAKSAADPLYEQFRGLPGIDRASNTPNSQQLEQFFANPTFANAADRAALSAQTRSGQTIDLTSNVSPDVLDRI
ncbi:MAG: hypothetical protein JKY81_01820, partial [Colwellia sp.]|nr:hypothetical protein [Colwellia sp.]